MAKINGAGATGAVQSTVRLSTLLSLTVLLSACDGRTSVSPTPPPADVITPLSETYVLSGVVFEINPNENAKPVLIEPRGTRRLPSQTLLDVRVSRAFRFSDAGRVELSLDLLNVLNDTAEESIGSAVYSASNVGQPDIFIDPRRAMLSVRLNLGR